MVTASGAPGTAALLRALRENGEREVRLVGTDMSDRSIGRHLCDAFHLVPAGSDPGFADALLELCRTEGVDAVLPQSSFDLLGLAEAKKRFEGIAVLVASPDAIHRSNDKAETYELLHRIGVRAPEFRRVNGAREAAAAAQELGYPKRPVCFKPVFSSGSRGFRVLDPTVDRAHQLLHERPGSVAMRLEEAMELLPEEGGPDLLVMELATGGERTIDGFAEGGRILLGHPKTREAMRAGLAMYFVTLESPELMEIAEAAHRRGVKVRVAPKTTELLLQRAEYIPGQGVPLFELRPPILAGADWIVKRTFDLIVSLFTVVAGLPLWLAIASSIKLTSSGPVFYRDRRVGLRHREFTMLKFRTMVAGADEQQAGLEASNEADGPLFKIRDDPRVTYVGAMLRRLSLDEIPQVLNVLRGEMSLVGPRPLRIRDYRRLEDWHRKRDLVLPGMTGLWQISGRSSLGFDDLVRLDFFYIENWSLWLDISILAKTVPAVLTRRGAY